MQHIGQVIRTTAIANHLDFRDRVEIGGVVFRLLRPDCINYTPPTPRRDRVRRMAEPVLALIDRARGRVPATARVPHVHTLTRMCVDAIEPADRAALGTLSDGQIIMLAKVIETRHVQFFEAMEAAVRGVGGIGPDEQMGRGPDGEGEQEHRSETGATEEVGALLRPGDPIVIGDVRMPTGRNAEKGVRWELTSNGVRRVPEGQMGRGPEQEAKGEQEKRDGLEAHPIGENIEEADAEAMRWEAEGAR